MRKISAVEFPTYEATQAMLKARGLEIASNRRRILAWCIDMVITCLISFLLIAKTGFGQLAFGELTAGKPEKLMNLFWGWTVLPFYHAICISVLRRTIGCWVSRIIVLRISGERLGFLYGFLRGFAMGIAVALFFPILIVLNSVIALIAWRGERLRMAIWDVPVRSIVVQRKQT